jgi:hypothetical protein
MFTRKPTLMSSQGANQALDVGLDLRLGGHGLAETRESCKH